MRYAVETEFIFYGSFYVEASDENQAKELVEKQCGMAISRGIHSTLGEDTCDWEFDSRPEKIISRVLEAEDGSNQ